MKGISRRDFMKYCMGSAAALGLDLSVLGNLQKALSAGNGLPKVIWLNGANCTGCTVSLANRFSDSGPTDVADLLIHYIDLAFHPNLMGAAGDLAVEQLNKAAQGDFILAIDGGIPTVFDGHTCILWTEDGHEVTAKEAVLNLGPKAAAVLCIGTCASFGGIPGGNPNPTGIVSVSNLLKRQTINISGCPTHPDWIVWTVANLLAGKMPRLDSQGRPSALFNQAIHKICPRKGQGETKVFGEDDRCLKALGCKGPETWSDCPGRQWNSGTNWCIGANSICLGCTQDGFPDKFSPLYKVEYGYRFSGSSGGNDTSQPTVAAGLKISKAEWRSDKKELRVDVKGTSGLSVVIKNASSGRTLGSGGIPAGGLMKFRKLNPSPVPCRVRVELDSLRLERAVANAPGNCK